MKEGNQFLRLLLLKLLQLTKKLLLLSLIMVLSIIMFIEVEMLVQQLLQSSSVKLSLLVELQQHLLILASEAQVL